LRKRHRLGTDGRAARVARQQRSPRRCVAVGARTLAPPEAGPGPSLAFERWLRRTLSESDTEGPDAALGRRGRRPIRRRVFEVFGSRSAPPRVARGGVRFAKFCASGLGSWQVPGNETGFTEAAAWQVRHRRQGRGLHDQGSFRAGPTRLATLSPMRAPTTCCFSNSRRQILSACGHTSD
jgi:hypothetical protein